MLKKISWDPLTCDHNALIVSCEMEWINSCAMLIVVSSVHPLTLSSPHLGNVMQNAFWNAKSSFLGFIWIQLELLEAKQLLKIRQLACMLKRTTWSIMACLLFWYYWSKLFVACSLISREIAKPYRHLLNF